MHVDNTEFYVPKPKPPNYHGRSRICQWWMQSPVRLIVMAIEILLRTPTSGVADALTNIKATWSHLFPHCERLKGIVQPSNRYPASHSQSFSLKIKSSLLTREDTPNLLHVYLYPGTAFHQSWPFHQRKTFGWIRTLLVTGYAAKYRKERPLCLTFNEIGGWFGGSDLATGSDEECKKISVIDGGSFFSVIHRPLQELQPIRTVIHISAIHMYKIKLNSSYKRSLPTLSTSYCDLKSADIFGSAGVKEVPAVKSRECQARTGVVKWKLMFPRMKVLFNLRKRVMDLLSEGGLQDKTQLLARLRKRDATENIEIVSGDPYCRELNLGLREKG
ncbi:hypothetical protein ARMSODRAFT_975858 [Armillaria solidipes]|uniref:Uncharacterized protein n=1 Tax=Armillaria solidipes TaxID=1076256 RepID=A0A2H3BNA5_9AGAR|nr:hypothetical protein ARMSODRAFT_975858 [Armillaria solidipes]